MNLCERTKYVTCFTPFISSNLFFSYYTIYEESPAPSGFQSKARGVSKLPLILDFLGPTHSCADDGKDLTQKKRMLNVGAFSPPSTVTLPLSTLGFSVIYSHQPDKPGVPMIKPLYFDDQSIAARGLILALASKRCKSDR